MQRLTLTYATKAIMGALIALFTSLLFVSIVAAQPSGPAAEDPFEERPVAASCDPKSGNTRFLGFPYWYEYLGGERVDDVCRPAITEPVDVWLIVAAAFEILLRVAGLAAVAFVIWGGYKYIMSRGSPNEIAAAKSTLVNAVLGLVFTVIAARLLGYLAGQFSGTANNDFLLPNVAANNNAISIILTIVFQLLAALAILMIVYGGITYIRSNGDPNTVKEAKQTILYALVGLLVAIFAQALVIFVFDRLEGRSTGGGRVEGFEQQENPGSGIRGQFD